MFQRNIEPLKHLELPAQQKSVKSHRTLKSSATLLWEPQILQGCSSYFNHVAVYI